MRRKTRILLLYEGLRGATFFRKVLSKHGYKVDVDHGSRKCLEKLSAKKYDAIILDSSVSGGNGLSLLRRIHSKYPQERVIVVSASPSWREGKEAYLEGAIDYISKSFDEESLPNVVREDLKKATHSLARKHGLLSGGPAS